MKIIRICFNTFGGIKDLSTIFSENAPVDSMRSLSSTYKGGRFCPFNMFLILHQLKVEQYSGNIANNLSMQQELNNVANSIFIWNT